MYYQTLPATALPFKRMDFRLPDWTKLMFGSGKVKEHWEPKVQAASQAWVEIEKLAVVEGIKPSILVYVHADQWYKTKQWADKHGLVMIALTSSNPSKSYSSYGSSAPGNTWRTAICRPVLAGEWMDVWHSGNDTEIGRLLGYPDCCRRFFNDYWVHEGYRDLTVPAAYKLTEPDEQVFIGDGPAESNILGRWAGIRLVSHMPCSFNCEHSEAIGKEHAEIGRSKGYAEQVETIYTLLNMPTKYSSMHGIAEITTPIYKISAASEPFAEDITFHRQGTQPEFASSGKDFPFNNTAKSVATESNSFKRSIEHYSQMGDKQLTIDIDPDAKPKLNGFGSRKSQQLSHEPILALAEGVTGRVVDFGCGNGALLQKIYQANPGVVDAIGVDYSADAIEYGKESFPGLQLYQGNLFEFDKTGDLAIFMPGRLVEIADDEGRGDAMLDRLQGFGSVIFYGYADWVEKIDWDGLYRQGWVLLAEQSNEHCTALKLQYFDDEN